MTVDSGGYITRRLHVPQPVWSQGGVKLPNVPEKVRVVEVLFTALEEAQGHSIKYFGVGTLHGQGIDLARKDAVEWNAKLEELCNICDGIVASFGKKLGVGEGLALKKSSGVSAGRLTAGSGC